MKSLNILILLVFSAQPSFSQSCTKHMMNDEVSHCEKSNKPIHKSEENLSQCPICISGLCLKNSFIEKAVLASEISKKTKKKNPRISQISTCFSQFVFQRNSEYQFTYKSPATPLPQSRNWQAFYAVFLN